MYRYFWEPYWLALFGVDLPCTAYFTSHPSTQLMVFRQALDGLSGYGEIQPDY